MYGLISEGKIRHERIGRGRGVIRIAPEALEAFLESRRVEAAAPEDGQRLKHITME
jgi:hypothetical protein